MKKLNLTFLSLLMCFGSFAQPITEFYDDCIVPDSNRYVTRYLCNSENGYYFPAKGKYRILVVFVNIIYDVTPNLAPNYVNPDWSVTNQEGINLLPPRQYFDDLFDVHNILPRQGFFTRFMSECSFDSLVLMGDFVTVEINQSTIEPTGGDFSSTKFMNSVISFINNLGGLQTYYGFDAIGNYDYATCGFPPARVSNNKFDYIAFFALNPTITHGGVVPGTGITSSGGLNALKLANGTMYPTEAWTIFGIGNDNLAKGGAAILVHEFAHGLLGGNAFHTSGGNHLGSSEYNTFIAGQSGYGLFSSCNAFRSSNAYERWRLGWRHPSNSTYKIAASGSDSDILTKFSGTKTFYLRDFVTYGDAIRIKLPYKDSEEASNQYIWLENHQLGKNGKLDGHNFHFYPGITCIPIGTPGIYGFLQVGRDCLEGESNVVYYSNEKDNLRMIHAEGNYNEEYWGNKNDCIPWTSRPTFEYVNCLNSNPLSGVNDQNEAIKITNNQTLQPFLDFTYHGNKLKDGVLYNQLIWCGDIFDAFTSGSVMDISSNPPPINAYTHYAIFSNSQGYIKGEDQRDTRRKYLTGLSIKMDYAYTLNGTDVFKVDVCWDDFDVKEDISWTGNIVLKEKLNLLPGKNITLAQNLTPYQINRDPISGVFAPPTLFTCEEGSELVQYPNSHVSVSEQSKMVLKSGSKYTISEDAILHISPVSTLEVEECATLEIKGHLFVQVGANINFHPNAQIVMESLSNIGFLGNVEQLIYPYVWQDPNIMNSTTISQHRFFCNDIFIHPGAILTITSTVKIAENCKIIIHPGGKLIIDGGTLTNACEDKLWHGIFVGGNGTLPQTAQNQGILEIKNGAVIENAKNAITTYSLDANGNHNWDSHGGIILAENSTFKNNRRSVEYMSYPPSISIICKNTFTY